MVVATGNLREEFTSLNSFTIKHAFEQSEAAKVKMENNIKESSNEIKTLVDEFKDPNLSSNDKN